MSGDWFDFSPAVWSSLLLSPPDGLSSEVVTAECRCWSMSLEATEAFEGYGGVGGCENRFDGSILPRGDEGELFHSPCPRDANASLLAASRRTDAQESLRVEG